MNTYNPYGFNNPYLPVNNTQNPFFMQNAIHDKYGCKMREK